MHGGIPECRIVVTRYSRDYEFVAVKNLMSPELVNESRSREPNETYNIILFVEKGPTSGTHARSLLIG